ncbi:T9SS C-terminal target domain-containing protein [Fibrella sp. HMF5335]|uniref:T9SS C-terminal target domain-containing protein n=1 Tax=Fibrella rubiginis TaxID=2817060 RepID=A0A939K4L6_9BACT|nr:T9SS C-terminal target domain-containing protein [Fibrella rubiginis]MBO0935530.1 T9SS C-terminal target domain-containing protein [Fibrella rubiginis]
MKKVIVLMLGLVASTASFAQQVAPEGTVAATPQTNMFITADQKIKLFVEALPATARITLSDAAGHALYAIRVPLNHGYGQQFDISNLGVGLYRLTVSTAAKTTTNTFVIQPLQPQTFIVQQS